MKFNLAGQPADDGLGRLEQPADDQIVPLEKEVIARRMQHLAEGQ